MPELQLTVLMSLACYRATRLVVKDSIASGPRIWLHTALYGKRPRVWREKLVELISCSFCISFWIAGALVWAVDINTSVPLPALQWAAVSAGSVLTWRLVEE